MAFLLSVTQLSTITPIAESLRSLLPLVDGIVVAVGKSDDKTLEYVQKIDKKKIHILKTIWDDTKREGGHVLAEETQKAYDAIGTQTSVKKIDKIAQEYTEPDWAFYLQGDEVLHEEDYEKILKAAEKYRDDIRVDGLLFKYRHFYGSYDYIGTSRRWYRREVRIVRPPRWYLKPEQKIYSYKDAQGFRKDDNKKLSVKEIGACVYHYGWVKPPDAQMRKQQSFHKYWHDDAWMKKNIPSTVTFDYSNIDSLAHFKGTHPLVMRERIHKKNWHFDFDISRSEVTLKEKISSVVEKITGYRLGEYKNFKII